MASGIETISVTLTGTLTPLSTLLSNAGGNRLAAYQSCSSPDTIVKLTSTGAVTIRGLNSPDSYSFGTLTNETFTRADGLLSASFSGSGVVLSILVVGRAN